MAARVVFARARCAVPSSLRTSGGAQLGSSSPSDALKFAASRSRCPAQRLSGSESGLGVLGVALQESS